MFTFGRHNLVKQDDMVPTKESREEDRMTYFKIQDKPCTKQRAISETSVKNTALSTEESPIRKRRSIDPTQTISLDSRTKSAKRPLSTKLFEPVLRSSSVDSSKRLFETKRGSNYIAMKDISKEPKKLMFKVETQERKEKHMQMLKVKYL
jgi:hypothetical protein